MLRGISAKVLVLASLLVVFTARDMAEKLGPNAVITQAINENNLVTLAGNTRPEAIRQNDLGPAADSLHLDMFLQLKRSPEQELAAKAFVESLTDKSSPNFHKWITAAEFGRRFGAAPEDIAMISGWLESHGFTVNSVVANRMVIDFSGTAGQVRAALHTEIHNLQIGAKRYFANMSDPRIPAALLPAVTGVVSLHNFKPHSMLVPRAQYTINPLYLALVPGDLATIYNLNPAFAAGYTGQGQTIVLIEDTDLFNGTGDWSAFRQTFGLNQYAQGSLTQMHPGNTNGGCYDPGVNEDDAEAAIDVEWATSAAPDATLILASCEGTTNFGGFIALQNLLTSGGAPPGVVSISYGESETENGAASNSYINTLYQTAAAAGVSVFVSSGDSAAAGSDRGGAEAVYGIGVSGWASTVYNVAVGGTDFGDYASGTTFDYWSPANGTYYNSARSYVREIPWNDSCGSGIAAGYYGFGASYGTAGFCNAFPYFTNTIGGAGGPSGCATGSRWVDYAVSGSCAGYPKPAWQSIPGNPKDGVRDLPDVALFASNGMWGHYYVVCLSAYAPCTGSPANWPGFGGTSVSSPIMAGIQALMDQAAGSTYAGNPNPVYYQIGQAEYGTATGMAACDSTTGPAATCSFNDVTQGDMVLPCTGQINCYSDGEALGVLSTSNTSYEPAYPAAPGWDFATGIGSVNAFNLLNAFVSSVSSSSPPAAPVLVSPASAATSVSAASSLTWEASKGATSYDVYFGTASTPPLVTNTASLTYSPGALNSGTTYYWAIGARNKAGANASAAWSFTTGCVEGLSSFGTAASSAGGTGTVPVSAGASCTWTAASNVPWITITAGASGGGNGTVAYTVAANVGSERAGTISIAGQDFTVTQTGIFPLISTLAGRAMPATPLEASSVSIPIGYGIVLDSAGDLYFPSPTLNAVFKADATGVVTRIAGTGVAGDLGEGGPALEAELNGPNSLALDSAGNLYIADTNNCRIVKVHTSGVIDSVAGNGSCEYLGDTGPATIASISQAQGIAVDSSGNLYISDTYDAVVRKVTPSGTITTVAGNGSSGYAGDGGPATNAQLSFPSGITVDSTGNLYIADSGNNAIRKVSASGNISSVAGGRCCYSGDGGPATSAGLCNPNGVAVDAGGDLFIADTCDDRIRKVAASGTISTVVGTGGLGFAGDGGPATSALLRLPDGVSLNSSGALYIADSGNARIREVSSAAVISTAVGGATHDGGLGVFGLLNAPAGVARDNAGNTYISDTNNNRVRKVAANGAITTVAGTGMAGFGGDGSAASSALLNAPQGLALDAAGNLYIADSINRRVRKVNTTGVISTVAGNGSNGDSGDGAAATSAQIGTPYGVVLDSSGNLYISDVNHAVVRKVAAAGTITTVAGDGSYGYSGDGGPATAAKLNDPEGLAVDNSGNLYIADSFNYRVRQVNASGVITTVAGNGECCYGGDGGPATSAELCVPDGVAWQAGALYIADACNNRVREVVPGGTMITIGGDGEIGYAGDGNLAIGATFSYPSAIAVDASGNLAVVDQNNNAVRLLTPANTLPVLSIQSVHTGTFAQGQSSATYAVTVSNGPGAGSTTGAVTVSEILPNALTLVSMSGTGWTCTASSTPACTRSDALSGSASYPAITVTVKVSASAPSQLTNQVTVSGGGGNIALSEDLTIVSGFVTELATAGQIEPFGADSIVAAYGSNLSVGTTTATTLPLGTSLNGTTVTVTDSAGVSRPALLFYVSSTQVNYEIPDGTAPGTATVTITNANGVVQTATIQVGTISPGLFALNSSGLVAAWVLPVVGGAQQSLQPVYQVNASKAVTALPINVAAADTEIYLEIYGTGVRHATTVTATVGGVGVPVLFFGSAPGYAGEDQVNIGPLPASLAGKGSVNVVVTADGQAANTVNVTMQ